MAEKSEKWGAAKAFIDHIGDFAGIAALALPLLRGKKPAPEAAPEKGLAAIKGAGGLIGDADEQYWIACSVRFREQSPELYDYLRRFLEWESEQFKKLEPKIGKLAAKWADKFHGNATRTRLAGLPPSDGGKTGNTKREWEEVNPQGQKVKVIDTKDHVVTGNSDAVKFLIMWGTAIKENYDATPKRLSKAERWNRACEATLPFLRHHQMPVPPKPEDVWDIQAFKGWVKQNGGKLPSAVVAAAKKGYRSTRTALDQAHQRMEEEQAEKSRFIRFVDRLI